MTDVLIKNWYIPECCMDCDPDFAYAIKCKAYNENNNFTSENCPLVEIKHSQDGDTISRADAIEAVRKELVCDGRHEAHDKTCRFIADVLLSALPSAEQVTGKLKNPCDSLLKSDSDECKEQKSKLDLISRADAIEAVRLETGKLGRGLLGRGDILDIISALPSAETTGALDDAITKYVADGLMEFPSAEAVQSDECDHCVYKWGMKGGEQNDD